MSEEFMKEFNDYYRSGTALMAIDTHERDRCIAEIINSVSLVNQKPGNDPVRVLVWSMSEGWKDEYRQPILPKVQEAYFALNQIIELQNSSQQNNQVVGGLDENVIYIMKDFGIYLHQNKYQFYDHVQSALYNLIPQLNASLRSIVFVGPNFKTPSGLAHEIKTFNYPLPSEEEIRHIMIKLCDENNVTMSTNELPHLVTACRGLVEHEVQDVVALASRRYNKQLDERALNLFWGQKTQIIQNTDILGFFPPMEGGLDNIGGLSKIKDHLELDRQCFSAEACAFGIKPPKGILIAGIPGTGKSLTAYCVANYFRMPLISLEIGNLMSKYVGESEERAIAATQLLDSLAPAVFWIDEVEKAFGGISGESDSGATQRVFGIFLKWMNDRTSCIYTVMTANDIKQLPIEFLRKGRIDEVFFVDLPDLESRDEIFRIQLRKRNRDDNKFECAILASLTQGFSGADIEAVVQTALKYAFLDKKSDIDLVYLKKAIKTIVPISKSDKERVSSIRNWGGTHAKSAHFVKEPVAVSKGRKIIPDSTMN